MANIYVSSGTSFSATISITYPAGSTCTVSNYKKTWTAPNTSGSWTFKAHEVGIYTVKAVNGSYSATEKVTITTEKQVKTVKLSYELSIITLGKLPNVGTDILVTNSNNGAQGTAYQLSLNSSDNGIIFNCLTNSTGYNSTLWYPQAISVKKYSALKIKILGWRLNESFPLYFGLATSQTNRTSDTATNFAVASKKQVYNSSTSLPLELTLDLSSFTNDTKYWIGASIVGTSSFNDTTYSKGGIKIASFQLV